jgi:methylmalonyl-CoA mutase C-terminal domain/subunit
VEAALQEDVDAIGLSILSGAHMSLMPRIMELLHEEEMMDVPVFLGGIVPDQDVVTLKEMGVAGVFGPGASIEEITTFIWGAIRGE